MHKICAALIKTRTTYADAAKRPIYFAIVLGSIGKILSTVLVSTVSFILRGDRFICKIIKMYEQFVLYLLVVSCHIMILSEIKRGQ